MFLLSAGVWPNEIHDGECILFALCQPAATHFAAKSRSGRTNTGRKQPRRRSFPPRLRFRFAHTHARARQTTTFSPRDWPAMVRKETTRYGPKRVQYKWTPAESIGRLRKDAKRRAPNKSSTMRDPIVAVSYIFITPANCSSRRLACV